MTSVGQTIWRYIDSGLNLFYPAICQICRKQRATSNEGYVCTECRGGAQRIERPFCDRCGTPFEGDINDTFICNECKNVDLQFDSARAAVRLNAFMLDVVHRYKYTRHMWLEKFLGDLLVEKALTELQKEHWDCIVPVPLHSLKKREREFNQAERLARFLGDACGIPVDTSILRRVELTQSQTRLTREEREKNVRKAFALRGEHDLTGKNIVVIDDILTTGATTSACAGMLRKAGASRIQVWTVARGT
jgi:competence protein ComFC